MNRALRVLNYACPGVVAILLAFPCLRFPFLYDDFDFIRRARSLSPSDFLPASDALFYRPLSREGFFGFAHLLHLDSPLALHLVNASLVVMTVAILFELTRSLLDEEGARNAALAYAGLGTLPTLVGWASGVQDLLAILFVAAALLFQLRGHSTAAICATVAAILSKESAVVLVPVIAVTNWVVARRPLTAWRVLPYAGILLAWASIHPGLHQVLSQGSTAGEPGYLSLARHGVLRPLTASLLSLCNLPLGVPSNQWGTRSPALVAALVLVVATLWFFRSDVRAPATTVPQRRACLLAVLLALPTLALPIALVRNWSPYYVCLPALGTSILIGAVLRERATLVVMGLLGAFVAVGVASRTAEVDATVTTERNLERTALALERVEKGFKSLYPSLPPRSVAYVSTQVHGTPGVYAHVYRFQALSVWYDNPSLLTRKPHEAAQRSGPEFLFWITPALEVGEVDPVRLSVRSSGGRPDYSQYQKTVRSFALGLAASGQAVRAARVLTSMPEPSPAIRGFDLRLAATLLLASGEAGMARQILVDAPPMTPSDALDAVAGIIADPPPKLALDDAALEAFGVERNDVQSIRAVMEWCRIHGYDRSAIRLAGRLLVLQPGDARAQQLLMDLNARTKMGSVTSHEQDE